MPNFERPPDIEKENQLVSPQTIERIRGHIEILTRNFKGKFQEQITGGLVLKYEYDKGGGEPFSITKEDGTQLSVENLTQEQADQVFSVIEGYTRNYAWTDEEREKVRE